MINGVDVSELQGIVNWQALKNSGIVFGIAKCYQGNDGIDSKYYSNIAGMQAAGIYSLAYHFVYPLPTDPTHPHRDPISQAQLHFAAAKGVRACCDLEWPTQADWKLWNIDAAFICQWVLAYLAEYSRLDGRPMIVYSYPDFIRLLNPPVEFAQYPYWAASYEPTPDIPAPFQDWVLWQNSGGTDYHLPNGAPCDTDMAKDLSLWSVPSVPIVATQSPSEQPPVPAIIPIVSEPIPTPTPAPAPANGKSKSILSLIMGFIENLLK
jgi:lysozyme